MNDDTATRKPDAVDALAQGLRETICFSAAPGGAGDVDGATCLLRHGHDGPHEWTPDAQWMIEFEVSKIVPRL